MNGSECALLGAVLSGFRDVPRLQQLVRPEDFEDGRHETVWRAALADVSAGIVPDPQTVMHRLRSQGDLLKVGGPIWLVELMEPQNCPLPANAVTYAAEVRQDAAERRLQDAAAAMSAHAGSGGDPDQTAARMRRALDDAQRDAVQAADWSMTDELLAFIDDLDATHESGPDLPWPDLNDLLNTLDPGVMAVVGARPGVGKSLFGTNTADHVARVRGVPTLFASLEMPKREVLARLVASRARVNLSEILNRRVSDQDHVKIMKAYEEIRVSPLVIDDTPSQTVSWINAAAARCGAKLIVVDYVQLVAADDKRLNRVEQISQITRDLKLVARERGACVLAMGQLNRNALNRTRPTLADFREGGSIENDTDVGIILHLPDPEKPAMEVYIDKNRNGPKGKRHLQVQGWCARLGNVSDKPWTPHTAVES